MKAFFKILIIEILSILMRILYLLFPIKNNRIVFNAYRGSQYSCNPKYISEYLVKYYPDKFDIIWAFNNPKKYIFLKNYGIKLVKYSSLRRFYYEATAKVSINNIGSYSWFPIRKGQEHVNTWHGGIGIKKCGLEEKANNNLMKFTIQMSSNRTTMITATSDEFYKDVILKDLGYKGFVLNCGYPRNDIFFDEIKYKENIRRKVISELKIPEDPYLILYAPTWRYNLKTVIEQLNFALLKETFSMKFQRETVIISRMHHLMIASFDPDNITINATDYYDMQKLLVAADCLITDYSSCLWDFALSGKPVYIYAPDIEHYKTERGFHKDFEKIGLIISRNNTELQRAIFNHTESEMKIKSKEFILNNGSYENGTACKQVCSWIYEKCFYQKISN